MELDLDEELNEEDKKGPAYATHDLEAEEMVNLIVKYGILNNASDIHIAQDRAGAKLRYRFDGILRESNIQWLKEKLQEKVSAVVSRIKIMSNLDIAEKRLALESGMVTMLQDGLDKLNQTTLSEIIRVVPYDMVKDFRTKNLAQDDIDNLLESLFSENKTPVETPSRVSLRFEISNPEVEDTALNHTNKTTIISVTSGKGGVGKTFVSINLSLQLAKKGYRVCLFDADLGLSNIDVMLGLNPAYSLQDLFTKDMTLQEIMIKDYEGIDIIPGGSGIEELARLSSDTLYNLIRSFSQLAAYDFLIIDTSAGISRNVISFCLSASEIVLVITPEPTSITDAYGLLKVLSRNDLKSKVLVLFNQSRNVAIAKKAYQLFSETVVKHLPCEIAPLGFILHDPKVQEAIREQHALMTLFPLCKAAHCFKQVAANLLKISEQSPRVVGLDSFWPNYLQSIQNKNLISEEPHGPAKTPAPVINPARDPEGAEGPTDREAPALPDDLSVKDQAPESEPVTPAPFPEPVRAPAPPAHKEPAMPDLVEAVYALTREIKNMRELLQKYSEQGGLSTALHQKDSRAPQPLKLDFDAYLQKQGIK